MNNKSDLLKQLKIDKDRQPDGLNIKYAGILSGVGAALLVIVLVGVFAGRDPVYTVSVAMARVEPAHGNTAQITLQATGYVTARRQATVSSKVMGKVDKLLVEEGEHVETGQVLAELDDSNTRKDYLLAESQLLSAEAQVHETEALLHEAELTVQRTRELLSRRLISQSEADSAEASYRSLQARLQSRQAEVKIAQNQVAAQKQRLEDLIIRAPFSGVVVAKNAQPGEMISPQASGGYTRTGICSIVDMTSLEIEVDVNEAYIDRVRPGQPVQAALDAYPDWRIPAKVAAIIPTADRQKATVKVRIAFEKLDPRILPDMGIKVAFLESRTTGGEAPGGLIQVPKSAILEERGQTFVFVVDNERAVKRQVELGRPLSDDKAVIAKGLKPGATYIDEIPKDLTDGAAVETQ